MTEHKFKPRRRKLAPYEDHMRQRIDERWTVQSITDELNQRFGVEVSYDSVREYLARRKIFSKAPRGRPCALGPEKRAQVLALQESGWSYAELAAEFKLHWYTIAKYLRMARQERAHRFTFGKVEQPAAKPQPVTAEAIKRNGVTICPPAYCAEVQGATPMPHSFGPTIEERERARRSADNKRRHKDRRRVSGAWR